MDQMASSVGGFITIDFKDTENPVIDAISYDFAASGYNLCIVDTKGNHADLTPEYAAIPVEMKSVAKFFGKSELRDITKEQLIENIAEVRHAATEPLQELFTSLTTTRELARKLLHSEAAISTAS